MLQSRQAQKVEIEKMVVETKKLIAEADFLRKKAQIEMIRVFIYGAATSAAIFTAAILYNRFF